MTAIHIVSNQRQNLPEPDTLKCFVLILIPLTFSYLRLSYPPYRYPLAPLGKAVLCGEIYRGVLAVLWIMGTTKEHVRASNVLFRIRRWASSVTHQNLHRLGMGGVRTLCPGSIVGFM